MVVVKTERHFKQYQRVTFNLDSRTDGKLYTGIIYTTNADGYPYVKAADSTIYAAGSLYNIEPYQWYKPILNYLQTKLNTVRKWTNY